MVAESTKPDEKIDNWILAALPRNEYESLSRHLEPFELPSGLVVHKANEPIPYVYFPSRAVISLVSTMTEGASVEVGLVGREGAAVVATLMGVKTTPNESVVQIPNSSLRIKPGALLKEFQRGGKLQQLLLRYTHSLMVQIGQTAACNRLHTIEERLARWLLMCHDRVDGDQLALTHEFLATMLGTRRADVTSAAITLQTEGFIRYAQGRIRPFKKRLNLR